MNVNRFYAEEVMTPLIERDGLVFIVPRFLSLKEASQCHLRLANELAWFVDLIQIYGRSVESPRRVSWYGDLDAVYTYSGTVHHPLPWHPLLREIRARLEADTGHTFNSVLCNLYRDGNDSMGWHADKEKELGSEPWIGSLSLGATRTFRIRHRKTGETHDIELRNGSLLIMAGCLQQYWRHCVPKTGKPVKSRINLSFRHILPLTAP